MMKRLSIYFCVLCGIFSFLIGCTAIQPFPTAARAGDTVTFAIGSVDDISQQNTTATFTSDADGVPIDITPQIRSIIKLYPDKTSSTWLKSMGEIERWSNHGGWQTVLVIDLPGVLPLGPATIDITTSGRGPNNAANIVNLPQPIEILAGSGNPNPFEYKKHSFNSQITSGNLAELEPMSQLLVRMPQPVSGVVNYDDYAAAEVVINCPIVANLQGTQIPVSSSDILVIADEQSRSLKAKQQMTWVRNGDEIKVIFMSVNGLLSPKATRFSVVFTGYGTPEYGPATLTSVTYWDSDGYEVSGPSPELVISQ